MTVRPIFFPLETIQGVPKTLESLTSMARHAGRILQEHIELEERQFNKDRCLDNTHTMRMLGALLNGHGIPGSEHVIALRQLFFTQQFIQDIDPKDAESIVRTIPRDGIKSEEGHQVNVRPLFHNTDLFPGSDYHPYTVLRADFSADRNISPRYYELQFKGRQHDVEVVNIAPHPKFKGYVNISIQDKQGNSSLPKNLVLTMTEEEAFSIYRRPLKKKRAVMSGDSLTVIQHDIPNPLAVDGPVVNLKLKNDKDIYRIGRTKMDPAKIDVVVSDSHVSAYHCEILRQADGWYVKDVGSANGTTVNGIAWPHRRFLTPIVDGDILVLGGHAAIHITI